MLAYGGADSRVGGRIFATLASQSQGYGNSMLPLEQQGRLRARIARGFPTDSGCWGRMGMTRIPLPQASEVVMAGALRTGWRLRTEKTTSTKGKKRAARRR